jgi:hypothetical protein
MDNSRLLDAAITCQMMLNYIDHFYFSVLIFPQAHIVMDQANAKVKLIISHHSLDQRIILLQGASEVRTKNATKIQRLAGFCECKKSSD